jgi:hypothetical protein
MSLMKCLYDVLFCFSGATLFLVIYDMMFFFIVIIITLNLIFGVIIDNFADLRTEKQRNDEILRNTCFICCKMIKREILLIKISFLST